MNKKFYIDKFILQGWFFSFFFGIILFIVYLILILVNKKDNSYLQIAIICFSACILIIKWAFQWVELDEKGIYAKSLFGLIKTCTWESIQKIEKSITLEGKHTPKYFIIFTDVNTIEGYRLTYNRDYLNIRVPSSKETELLIKKYYKKEIIDISYEMVLERR